MDGELLAAVIFYSIIGILIFINRKKFEWIQGIILAYRTKKPLKWMDALKPESFFWKIYGTLCIPIAFYFMPQLIYLLGGNAMSIIVTPEAQAGVAPAIPGVRIPGSPLFIPLFYGIISIGVLALFHEMAHGIIGKSEKIKINNSGFGMMLIFPLFFVEPDEKSLIKASKLSRLRMISAGAATNIILSFIIFNLTALTLTPFMSQVSVSEGIRITSLMKDYPAINAGITEGTVITGINNKETLNITSFSQAMNELSPESTIILNTNQGNYELITSKNPQNESLPYLGIYIEEAITYSSEAVNNYSELGLNLIKGIYELLLWIALLNFAIGIMNLLPIVGLDGSKLLNDLLSYLMSNKAAGRITMLVSSICLGLLIINIMPFFINLFS